LCRGHCDDVNDLMTVESEGSMIVSKPKLAMSLCHAATPVTIPIMRNLFSQKRPYKGGWPGLIK